MGADLFESFVGSIIASISLASDLDIDTPLREEMIARRIALPIWIAGFGIITSVLEFCL
eukprot:TRINITY_DN4400_c0_g1_i1.p3 TRINITY_DN4400_c0_g1~~TRINITY_DN4400_c0_g1_i1.p3  ORF type:complete len:59 (-),score=13.08 TRINITY_DN4400_c0_g1_i1:104-280(-)